MNNSTALVMSEMDFNDVERLISISSICLNEKKFVSPGVKEVYFFIEIELEFIVSYLENSFLGQMANRWGMKKSSIIKPLDHIFY